MRVSPTGSTSSWVTWWPVRCLPARSTRSSSPTCSYPHRSDGPRCAAPRHAAQFVAPGGTLLVVGHDTTNLADGVGGPQDPAVLFTPEEVQADLADLPDLIAEKAGRVRRPMATSDGERVAVDALVRVRRTTGGPSGR